MIERVNSIVARRSLLLLLPNLAQPLLRTRERAATLNVQCRSSETFDQRGKHRHAAHLFNIAARDRVNIGLPGPTIYRW